jgi:F-type H+-transporting ATPase subunit delta
MASDFEIFSAAGAIYAESLLELAQKAGKADEIGDELEGLREIWRKDPQFAAMMSSLAVDQSARRESIRKIFTGKVSTLVLNLLLVLNDKGRTVILPYVVDSYRKKLNEIMGRAVVRVTTVQPLDDNQRQRLAGEIKRRIGREAKFVESVDPELLGGLSVQVDDRIYDFSVRTRLEEMRKRLLNSGQRHLTEGAARFVLEG